MKMWRGGCRFVFFFGSKIHRRRFFFFLFFSTFLGHSTLFFSFFFGSGWFWFWVGFGFVIRTSEYVRYEERRGEGGCVCVCV